MAEDRKVIEKKEVTLTLPVVKAPKFLQGFVTFVREQGVIGVAVGLILGLAAKSLVDSFVGNVINPIVGVILGSSNLATRYMCIDSSPAGVCASKVGYGQFVSDIISFLIIAAVVYFVVKGLKLERLDKKKEDKK